MESNKMFSVKCTECDVKLEDVWCTYTELQKTIEAPCPACGGKVDQTIGFGYGKFRGSGFTKDTC